jgi:hypothetical protein
VSDDPDLRTRLERLASSVGDPPEQGLERVAARRHRRLRRRRGAVVTAAALAVLLIGISAVLEGGPDEREVTVSPAERVSGAEAQLPRTLEIFCEPTGIDIPIGSVRPQRDGLHVRVVNRLTSSTDVWVDGQHWSSGRQSVPPGETITQRYPAPPGNLTIGCTIAGHDDRLSADLVDVDGYYQEPRLSCDEDEITELADLPLAESTDQMLVAARRAFEAHWGEPVDWGDDIETGAVRGYEEQRLGDRTLDPIVQVAQDDKVVAFVHLRGPDGVPAAPWETASIDACAPFLEAAPTTTAPGD